MKVGGWMRGDGSKLTIEVEELPEKLHLTDLEWDWIWAQIRQKFDMLKRTRRGVLGLSDPRAEAPKTDE